jgi:fluoroacetyl-CoA thioesterase
MKTSLQAGISNSFTFRIDESKCVPALYPEADEFQAMPKVFATGFMVGFLEWTCIQAVMPHLDWPDEQSVGTHIDVSHLAATPPGLKVTATVTLVEVDGRRLIFEVEAHDGVDPICRGRHERFVINKGKFDRKLMAKTKGAAR